MFDAREHREAAELCVFRAMEGTRRRARAVTGPEGCPALVTIALILIVAWLAILILALAVARAGGRADGDEERLAARHGDADRLAAPSRFDGRPPGERPPLEALADEIMRAGATVSDPDRPGEQPIPDRPATTKRFKKPARLNPKTVRIKHLRH